VPLLLLLAALAVLAAIAVVAAGPGGSMGTATRERSPRGELPVDDVDRAAIEGLRFSLAFRGYRMDEVDDVLGRLAYELEIRDDRIAELEGTQGESEQSSPPGGEVRRATDARNEGREPTDAPNEV
jgi:DivIVA domain-containing protein